MRKGVNHEQFSSLTVPGLDEWTCCDNSTGKWLASLFLSSSLSVTTSSSVILHSVTYRCVTFVSCIFAWFFKAPTHTHAHTHSREASRLFSLLVFLGKCVICSSQRFWNVVWWPLIHPTVHPSQQGGDGLHSPRTTCKWTNAFLSETRTQCELKRHSHFPIQTQFKTHWACQWYNHPY